MILIVTTSHTRTVDDLVSIFTDRHIDFFRFNTDLYDNYQFLWQGDNFEIIDPVGRVCNSAEVSICVMYKSFLRQLTNPQIENPRYIMTIVNGVCCCIANWALQRKILRLWHPHEYAYPKTLQMEIAKKYFSVPPFSLHWGFSMSSKEVVAKQLVQQALDDNTLPYVERVDRALLDTKYPWLTQNVALGDRDATVLYINGAVHGYQFATERKELMDWRTTQGTELNKWVPWDTGKDFQDRIRAYMNELKLKFGRFDFIIGGQEPQFLEVNSRGQFGWLEKEEDMALHNEVADAILDPSSTIEM